MQDANMKKAPSVRELSEKRTEGEKLALFKTLDKGNALSPTRFAGPLTRPDPSVASRHLPAVRGVTHPEGPHKRHSAPFTQGGLFISRKKFKKIFLFLQQF